MFGMKNHYHFLYINTRIYIGEFFHDQASLDIYEYEDV
jgi:hypothetical protein